MKGAGTSEPRIVTPQQAQDHLKDYSAPLPGAHHLLHTIATEPERIAEAVFDADQMASVYSDIADKFERERAEACEAILRVEKLCDASAASAPIGTQASVPVFVLRAALKPQPTARDVPVYSDLVGPCWRRAGRGDWCAGHQQPWGHPKSDYVSHEDFKAQTGPAAGRY